MKWLAYFLAILFVIVLVGAGGFAIGRSWALREQKQQAVRLDTKVHVEPADKPEPIDGWTPAGLYTEKITWRFTGLTRRNPKTTAEEAHYVYTLALKNIYDSSWGKSRGYKVKMHFLFMDEAGLVLYESPMGTVQFPISEPNYVAEFDGSGWLPSKLGSLVRKAGWRGEMEIVEPK